MSNSQAELDNELDKKISRLHKKIQHDLRRERRVRLLILFLEFIVVGIGWYFYGWQMLLITLLLLWIIKIKTRKANG